MRQRKDDVKFSDASMKSLAIVAQGDEMLVVKLQWEDESR